MKTIYPKVRITALRVLYFITFIALAPSTLPALFESNGVIDLNEGLVLAFWSALSLLALLGVIYPLKLIPLLLVQLVYKALWLFAVALPLYRGNGIPEALTDLVFANSVGVILDILIIPWGYVLFQIKDTRASLQTLA